ncbi:MAG: cytochrome c biogenesis protein CcsA [Bacteroidia bacterium]
MPSSPAPRPLHPLLKGMAVLLLAYTFGMGWLGDVPRKVILNESVRNLYFHVPMWFGMLLMLLGSAVYSVRYLLLQQIQDDTQANALALVGLVFGFLGLFTGMVWAQFTWGAWWSGDPKQNASAMGLLLYLAYLVLRSSFEDTRRRARMASVYNVLAFFCLIPLLFILPRLTDSLHPGNGGNPGFSAYDLDGRMRWVFYPAVLGWTLTGWWMANLWARFRHLETVKPPSNVTL